MMEPDSSIRQPVRAVAYTPGQKFVHWTIALAIAVLVPVGIVMTRLGFEGAIGATTGLLYGWHKLIGFVVLVLACVRIVLRLRCGAPALPSSVPRPQQLAAGMVHGALYVLLLVVPLSGWAGVTAYPATLTVAGISLPSMPFVPVARDLAERLLAIHGALALVLVGLVAAHVGAALLHLVVKKDGVFERMWPQRPLR